MKVTVTEPISGVTTMLETLDDITIETLRGLIEIDFHIAPDRQQLFVSTQLLDRSDNSKSLKDIGFRDGDVIVVVDSEGNVSPRRMHSSLSQELGGIGTSTMPDFFQSLDFSNVNVSESSSISASQASQLDLRVDEEADMLLSRLNSEPMLPDQISPKHPEVGEALRRRDRIELKKAIKAEHEKQRKELVEQRRKWMEAVANPFHPDSQKLLLEEIQQQRIEESYFQAQEYLPESFGNVFMLYVNIEVNHIKLKAFIDSGAQSTIMSRRCAERCNLMRLVDTRFSGIAHGVGASRIIGRIHVVQIKMGNQFFAASVTVLEDDKVDFLFGLDLLRRHQCVLDLKNDVLRIGHESLPFLSEKETKGDIFNFGSGELSEGVSTQSLTLQPGLGSQLSHNVRPIGDGQAAEDKVKRLLDLGFSRDASIQALEATEGNVDVAASLLFQQNDSVN